MIHGYLQTSHRLRSPPRWCCASGAKSRGHGSRGLPSVLPGGRLHNLPVLRLTEAPGEVQLLHGSQRLHAPSLRWDQPNLLLIQFRVQTVM
uniref:Uncharacterized protein n=1 Tax=Triticum urartu TaxID=4572 RepID=A0A8R7TB51_TRIUA